MMYSFFLISLIGISQKAFHGAQRPGDNDLSLDLRFRNLAMMFRYIL